MARRETELSMPRFSVRIREVTRCISSIRYNNRRPESASRAAFARKIVAGKCVCLWRSKADRDTLYSAAMARAGSWFNNAC
jgi:hypothetical protein